MTKKYVINRLIRKTKILKSVDYRIIKSRELSKKNKVNAFKDKAIKRKSTGFKGKLD